MTKINSVHIEVAMVTEKITKQGSISKKYLNDVKDL